MLFILTGNIMTGKTRWLQALVEELEARGFTSWGVLAPGLWTEVRENDSLRFEKRGIDNVLLPEKKVIPFAISCDFEQPEWASEQSDSLGMKWRIRDESIEEVNIHFDSIAESVSKTPTDPKNNLLIVDEMGRLELLCNQGLTSALNLLKQGPSPLYKHAIVVVRDALADEAQKRFGPAWGHVNLIGPNEAAREQVLRFFETCRQS